MEQRELGTTGIQVSVICYGAWGIGGAPWWTTKGDEVSRGSILAAVEEGINFFDTAPAYGWGHSERLLGDVLKPFRDTVVLATKCGLSNMNGQIVRDLKPAAIRKELDVSLRNLKTEYIDLYQIHWPSPNDSMEHAMEELAKAKEKGKIRAIGVSNFDLPLLERARKVVLVDCVQPKYNLLERDIEADILPYCAKNKIGVIAYSPLSSGLLTGKYGKGTHFEDWRGGGGFGIFRPETLAKAYDRVEKLKATAAEIGKPPAHIAINWVIANPAVTAAIVGVKDAAQLKDGVKCLRYPLTTEEKKRVELATG
ncbi:MAG: aldo/keto reductase [Nitrospinae bacterium]|nr:aldo/keto reductase [Nitrospinota bacterium]